MDDSQMETNTLNARNPYEDFVEDDSSINQYKETSIHQEASTHHISIQTDCTDMDKLGLIFEQCIQEVSRLEMHRDGLIQELVELQRPVMEVVKQLRVKLMEAQRLVTLAQLDYITVYEDVQEVRKKLFTAARDAIQHQVTLAAREYEVAQSNVTQDELRATIQSLTEEISEVQKSHQERMRLLKSQASAGHRHRTMSDSMSLCRQASLRLQRRLSGSLKSLENWYEPRLLALLRRRQIGEDGLKKYQEQATDLRAQLEPLTQDIHRLELQRSSLEQKIALMEAERKQNQTQHKEKVEKLKVMLCELEAEFETQRTSKKIVEELKDGLMRELEFLRGKDDLCEDLVN